MDRSELEALVSTWEEIQGTSRPLAPFFERLRHAWRAADEAFDADPDPRGIATLGKWVCRRLWEQIQEQEAALAPWVRGLLVRTGIWSIEEAVLSAWAATASRRSECADERYFEGALLSMIPYVEDGALPDLVRAVAPLGGGLDGRFARDVVRRMLRAGQLGEARGALGLAHAPTFASLVLTMLAPHLGAEDLARAVRAVWEMARAEMAQGEMARASRCEDWARLLPLSEPGVRADRVRELEAVVGSLSPEWYEACPDYDDLRGLVAIALADLGQTSRALEWAHRVPAPDRHGVLADLLPHLDASLREALALDVVREAAAARDHEGSLLARLAPTSAKVAGACLEAARTLADAEDRLTAEIDLLPFLSPEDVTPVLHRARDAGERLRWRAIEALETRAAQRALSLAETRWLDSVLASPTVLDLAPLARVIAPEKASALLGAMQRLLPLAVEEDHTTSLLEALDVLADRASGGRRDHRTEILDLVRRAPDGLAGAPATWALFDTEELRARATRELLQSRRREPPRRIRSVGLIYELCSMPRGAVKDAPGCVARLAGPRRALALALCEAGPWGRAALLSRIEVGWHYLVERLLLGLSRIDLDEAAILAACRLESAEAWIRWLDDHPPLHLDGALQHLDVPELQALGRALAARPIRPSWAEPLIWVGPVPPREEQRERGEEVLEVLRGLGRARQDPAIRLFPAADRAAERGFLAEVGTVARETEETSVRLGLLSILASHSAAGALQAELEAEIGAVIDADVEVGDDAFGRVAPHQGARTRARMWGHAFSLAWLRRTLPFSWESRGALEVIASLRGGDVGDLVEWAARVQGG